MNASSSENNSPSEPAANTSPISDSEVRPNWYWLQARLLSGAKSHQFSDWLTAELSDLESAFEDLCTVDSLKKQASSRK